MGLLASGSERGGPLVPQLAKEHGIRFFETSAKSSVNVEEVSGGATQAQCEHHGGVLIPGVSPDGGMLLSPMTVPSPQAFSTLARDILQKSSRKAVSGAGGPVRDPPLLRPP